jgi:deazaflavin-dependent oxidoreductase (nitroreductase family)
MSDWDDKIIAEFRDNDGTVGGPFTGAHLVLLTTKGAKSGLPRIAPMMYFAEGDEIYVIASKGGAPDHPAWYHNLVANPDVTVEQATVDGIVTYEATAEVVTGSTRDHLFNTFATRAPGFAEYQKKTERLIPVVGLKRKTA